MGISLSLYFLFLTDAEQREMRVLRYTCIIIIYIYNMYKVETVETVDYSELSPHLQYNKRTVRSTCMRHLIAETTRSNA